MFSPDGILVFARSTSPRSGQDPSPGDDNTHLFLPILPDLSLIFLLDPFNSQILYVGTSIYGGGGVFKSINSGGSWTASLGGEPANVKCLTIDPSNPQTLYDGTDGGGVCKSSDGGVSWVAISSGLTNSYVYMSTSVWWLAIAPSNPQILYAGTADGEAFRLAP